ncbi:MAG: hypothetical protein JOY90_22345, partial [Bradyrhizobium sp.]|nr:hypothetical protein [Bradyrhizobium sp.]
MPQPHRASDQDDVGIRETAEDFDRLAEKALRSEAPALIALRIDGAPGVSQTVRDPGWIRNQFMRGA